MAGYCTRRQHFHSPSARVNTSAHSCNIQPYFTFTRAIIYNIEVFVLLEHVLISYTGGVYVCYLWVLEACKPPRGAWESSESLCWMMPIVEFYVA